MSNCCDHDLVPESELKRARRIEDLKAGLVLAGVVWILVALDWLVGR